MGTEQGGALHWALVREGTIHLRRAGFGLDTRAREMQAQGGTVQGGVEAKQLQEPLTERNTRLPRLELALDSQSQLAPALLTQLQVL